jgi:hypothetical protein
VYRVLVEKPEGKRPLGRPCKYGDEPAGSGVTELDKLLHNENLARGTVP